MLVRHGAARRVLKQLEEAVEGAEDKESYLGVLHTLLVPDDAAAASSEGAGAAGAGANDGADSDEVEEDDDADDMAAIEAAAARARARQRRGVMVPLSLLGLGASRSGTAATATPATSAVERCAFAALWVSVLCITEQRAYQHTPVQDP